MRRTINFAVAALVAGALAMPAESWAQASRRGGSDSSGSSSSGGSSAGPRSSGGDSGGSSSASPRVAQPRSSGGAASGGGQASSAGPGPTVTRSSGADASGARARGDRAIHGTAQGRDFWRPGVTRPTYVIRSYVPWYGYGYYDPWFYGYGYRRWGLSPYGIGIGAFGYPYGMYDPYLDPYGYGGYSGGSYARRQDDDTRPTGSIRVRAQPKDARVYIDGALVGTVDEFDGLSDHLEVEPGTHRLEIRADGFETFSTEIRVRENRTITARANLRQLN